MNKKLKTLISEKYPGYVKGLRLNSSAEFSDRIESEIANQAFREVLIKRLLETIDEFDKQFEGVLESCVFNKDFPDEPAVHIETMVGIAPVDISHDIARTCATSLIDISSHETFESLEAEVLRQLKLNAIEAYEPLIKRIEFTEHLQSGDDFWSWRK